MSAEVTSSTSNIPETQRAVSELFSLIRPDLDRVEELLQDELRNDAPFVDELLRYGCLLGGKRLRPALVLLTAQAAGGIRHAHHVLAAVVEMIHTATLIHDDVLDEAKMRRHLATVNSRWDNQVSVLLGDYLFTHAFYLASTLDSPFACQTIGRSTNLVCEGELRQVGHRGDFQLTEAQYMEIIGAKTAELCACCCRLGAYYAEAATDVVDHLNRYGWNLGCAFQIADDLLDLVGEQQSTGKSLGTDLDKRKTTLPLLHVLEVASDKDQVEIREILESDLAGIELRAAIDPWLEHYDGLDYARCRAIERAEAAQQSLDILADSPAKDLLLALCDFVVARSA